jgi:hypothetical protein
MAGLSKIRQRSALMIAVIAFAFLHLSLVICSKVVVSMVPQRCRKHQWKDISFEDFRIKVSREKKWSRNHFYSSSNQSMGSRGFDCFIDF